MDNLDITENRKSENTEKKIQNMDIQTEVLKTGKIRNIEDRLRWLNIYLIQISSEKRENILKTNMVMIFKNG